MLANSMGSLNVTDGCTLVETPVAPAAGLVEETNGFPDPAAMLNRPDDVPKEPSVLTTSSVVEPVGAELEIVTFAFTDEQDVKVTELTVTPVAPRLTVAPLAKFDPATVRSSVAPLAADDGLTDVIVGRGSPDTSFE